MDKDNPTTDHISTNQPEALAAVPSESPSSGSAAPTVSPRKSFLRELVLAIIEHANRSIAIVFIAFLVVIMAYCQQDQLSALVGKTKSIKAGGFELQLQEAASTRGVAPEFARLAGLNDQQLQLFLIVGKKRGTNAAGTDGISYTGEEVTKENLYKLQEIGVLTVLEELPDNRYRWQLTDKGVQLHELLRGQILISVREAAKESQGK